MTWFRGIVDGYMVCQTKVEKRRKKRFIHEKEVRKVKGMPNFLTKFASEILRSNRGMTDDWLCCADCQVFGGVCYG